MSMSETVRGVIQESVESMALAPGINGSTWSPDAAYAATTLCGRRSTTC
jgi:hypothetical protein